MKTVLNWALSGIPQSPLMALLATILVFNVLAWAGAFGLAVNQPEVSGLLLLAWFFGLRHAFDVDHIGEQKRIRLERSRIHQSGQSLVDEYFLRTHQTKPSIAKKKTNAVRQVNRAFTAAHSLFGLFRIEIIENTSARVSCSPWPSQAKIARYRHWLSFPHQLPRSGSVGDR